jgi:hypothetical protein
MTEDVDRTAMPLCHGIGDAGDVLELALDPVRQCVSGSPATAPIDRDDGPPGGQSRPDDPERRVIGGRAMDEDDRWPIPPRERGDRRAIARPDDSDILAGPRRHRSGRHA